MAKTSTAKDHAAKVIQAFFAFVLAFGLMVPSLALAPPKAAYAGSGDNAAIPEVTGYLDESLSVPGVDNATLGQDTGLRMISKQTFVTKKASDSSSIDEFFDKYGLSEMVTMTMDTNVPVFTVNETDEWLVAFVGKSVLNMNGSSILAYDLTDDDAYTPTIYNERSVLDAESGILYISRDAVVDNDNSVIPQTLSAQLLISTNINNGQSVQDNLTSTTTVTIDNQSGNMTAPSAVQNIETSAIDMTTTIPVATKETAANIDVSDLEIYLNGSSVPLDVGGLNDEATDNVAYNPNTGELSIAMAPADLARVDVKIKEQGFFDKLFGSNQAYALTDYKSMKNFSDVVGTLKVTQGELKEGAMYYYSGDLAYGRSGKGNSGKYKNIYWKSGWRKEAAAVAIPYAYVGPIGSNKASTPFLSGTAENSWNWDNYINRYGEVLNASDEQNNYLWNFMFALPVSWTDAQSLHNTTDDNDVVKLNIPNAVYEGHYNTIATCTHNSAGIDDDFDEDLDDDISEEKVVYARILKLDESDGTVVIGFGGEKDSDNQQGYAIYKFSLETTGKLSPKKVSANTSITNGNVCYSLAGAEYGVYEKATNKEVTTFTTKADGSSDEIELNAGEYYVKEKKASTGYLLDETQHPLTIKSGETTPLELKENPGGDPIGIKLQKIDIETGKPYGVEKGSLANAEFTYKYYANTSGNTSGEATRTWVYKTNENGALLPQFQDPVSGDLYKSSDGKVLFPIGTYTVQETKAPEGYLIDSKIQGTYVLNIKTDGTGVEWTDKNSGQRINVDNVREIPNEIMRMSVEFTKIGEDQQPLANVAFVIRGVTSGEWHVVVTDENGQWDSENNKADVNTNAFDAAVTQNEDGSFTLDEAKLNEILASTNGKVGTWFGMDEKGNKSPVADDDSFPYGDYELIELKSSVNKNYNMVTRGFYIKKDDKHLNIGTITDTGLNIGTQATVAGAKTFLPNGEVTIDDLVKYEGLTPGKEYKLVASLMDADAEKPITVDGNPVVADPVTFTPSAKNGEITIPIKFNASEYDKAKFVVYEELYDADDNILDEEKDPKNPDQTVESKPDIGTTATDKADGDHQIPAAKDQVISDEVRYEGLIEGQEYIMVGNLMDADTEKPIEGVGTVEVPFTAAEGGAGTVTVEFKVDASALSGVTTVVYEDCYDSTKKVKIAAHADPKDTPQQVEVVPEIGTTATDKADGDHNINAAAKQTIVDKVTYNGLKAGTEYTMVGTLMDKNTEKPLQVGGKEVVVTKNFTPKDTAGEVELEFAVDGTALAGTTTVVYEEAYVAAEYKENGDKAKPVASHKDITDKGQTITIGSTIGTTLTNAADGKSVIPTSGTVTVVDTVEYDGLVPGKSYTLVGTLMNKDTGVALTINNKVITATKEFTPKKSSGTEDIKFSFDASKVDSSALVAYERLYDSELGTKSTPVATHENLNDEAQTVSVGEPDNPGSTPKAGGGSSTTSSPLLKTGLPIGISLVVLLLICGGAYGYLRYRNRYQQ